MTTATKSHHLASRWINDVLVWDLVSQHTVQRITVWYWDGAIRTHAISRSPTGTNQKADRSIGITEVADDLQDERPKTIVLDLKTSSDS